MPSPIRSHRLSHRLLTTAVLLLVAVLPGCLTQALWTDELVPPGVPEIDLHPVSVQTRTSRGDLDVLAAPVDGATLLRFRDGADGRVTTLAPDTRDGEPSRAAAMAWMLASGSCEVVSARLLLDSYLYLGEGTFGQAEFELAMRPRLERLGGEVEATALPPALRSFLVDDGLQHYAFEGDDSSPANLGQQCRRRLGQVDFAKLLDVRGPVTVERVAFTDEEGRVVEPQRPPIATDVTSDDGPWVVSVPEPERLRRDLALLTGQTMWVAVRCDGAQRLLRFDPAELWLFDTQRRGDHLVHRSRWRPVALPEVAPPLLAALPVTMVHTEHTIQRELIPNDGLPVWEKMLWTPVTLAADILFQILWQFFVPWRQYDNDHGVGRGR